MRSTLKYCGNSRMILPPKDNHDFSLYEIETIVKKNENRILFSKEPKIPKNW